MKFLYNVPFILFALLSLLWGGPLLSAEECSLVEKRWTVAQLLDTALRNNPETRLAWWNAQRAAAAVGSAKSAYYPQVALDANVRHGRDFQFTNGPDVNYTIFQADLILTFLLADFGERAANLQAEMMALEAAGWQSQWTIQKVMADVFEYGYSTIAAQDTLEAFQISLEDAKQMLDAASKLNQAGLSPISDVYSSKAALAQIEIEVVQQRSQLEIQRAKLATTLGFEADTPLKLMSMDALTVPQQQLSQLICLAKKNRQDLMAQRARVAEAVARKNKVVAHYKPKLFLNANGGAEHAVNDKANAGNYRITLNLEAPLFTGFDAVYQNRMASADVKISEEALLQLELEMALEVLTQSSSVGAAKEMLHYAKINLENAQAAYEAVLEKYNAGKERIAEVSIALRQIVTARVRYSEINSRYLVAVANLAYATGTLVPPME